MLEDGRMHDYLMILMGEAQEKRLEASYLSLTRIASVSHGRAHHVDGP